MVILCGNIDVNIRMRLLQRLNSLRSCDQAHKCNILTAALLNKINGSCRTSACREHRIHDKDFSVFNICRELAVIFHRLVRLRITVKTDMAYFCVRNQ